MFNEIAGKFSNFGYNNIDGCQCDEKWRSLKRSYMKIKDNMAKSGAGRIRFEFFQEMDDVLGSKPNVSAEVVYESEMVLPSYRGKLIKKKIWDLTNLSLIFIRSEMGISFHSKPIQCNIFLNLLLPSEI